MDRRKTDSYEEIHAMLVEAMQDACANEESGDYELPNIVPGYVYNKYNAKISVSRFSRFSKVAAVFVIVLLGMNLFVLTSDSSEAYGDKGLLHRIFEGSRGIFTDQDESEIVEFDETGDIYILTDFSEIDEAKKFWSELDIPKYIPYNYEFKKLCITKNLLGDYLAEYDFVNNDKILEINIVELDDEVEAYSNNTGEIINLSDRIINVYWDEIYGKYVADVYFDNHSIYIYGCLEKDEIVKIATNIK